jgi:hypothetical protein
MRTAFNFWERGRERLRRRAVAVICAEVHCSAGIQRGRAQTN